MTAAARHPFLSARPGYFQEPLPSETDLAIRSFVVSLEGADGPAFEAAMAQMALGEARMLLCFALRMATHAVRISSPIQVRFGLLAAVLAVRGEDAREVSIVLGVLFDAGDRSGGEARGLFEGVARDVPAEGAGLLRAFLRRPDLDNILEAMWFRATHDDNGRFEYRSLRAASPDVVAELKA